MPHVPLIPNLPIMGITMRLLPQTATGDTHDALSQDWGRFLAAAGITWIPLPNRGEETLAMVKALGLGGFILSGGGEAGKEPLKDVTEALLIHHAQHHRLPVLGICRGLQAIQLHLGGQLCPVTEHVATRHRLWSAADAAQSLQRDVNSYHNLGIEKPAAPLTPLAFSQEKDGHAHIEAAWAPGILGLMWHPEREKISTAKDVTLIRNFLAFPEKKPKL